MRSFLVSLPFFGGCMGAMSPLPDLPIINLTFPSTPLIDSAVEYAEGHTSPNVANHCVRSAYWALILAKKHPDFAGKPLNMEVVVFSAIMHDLGWTTNKSLLSEDKRFEVDGANLARAFLDNQAPDMRRDNMSTSGATWDKQTVQLVWDAIALHTTPSIGMYKEPEVALTQMGIGADGLGAGFPGGFITDDEYKAVATRFPRVGWKNEFVQLLCGLCRDKASTTFDNVVGEFGLQFGLDGNGTDKDEYKRQWDANRSSPRIVEALESLE